MRKARRFLLCSYALRLLFGAACSTIYRRGDSAVEKLRQGLVDEKFDEVYHNASSSVQAQVPHDEFIARLRAFTDKLKSVDPEIRWVRNTIIQDNNNVSREDNHSSLKVEKGGRRVNIRVSWSSDFKLCGISLIRHANHAGEHVFRHCD